MTENPRPFVLQVAGTVRGRFKTRWEAEKQMYLLERLSQAHGNPPGSITAVARVVVERDADEAR